MLVEDSSCYIIKQSKETTWKFLRSNIGDIIYKKLESGIWSDENLLVSQTANCYSVCLAPDDTINVFFQSKNGDIKLLSFFDNCWSEKLLLKKKPGSSSNIYFKAVLENNNIHLVYSIPDEKGVLSALVHQISYLGNQLQEPKAIEIIRNNNICPFRAYLSNNSDIIIIYEKEDRDTKLGYRIYHSKLRQWSNFFILDNINILKDISLLSVKNKKYISYVKSNDNIDTLSFLTLEDEKPLPKVIIENGVLFSCAIYNIDEHIWILADTQNGINSWFSIDEGNSFNGTSIGTMNASMPLMKAKYISNFVSEKDHLNIHDIYITKDTYINIPVIDELYPAIVGNKNTEVSLQNTSLPVNSYIHQMKSIISDTSKRLSDAESKLIEKDTSILKLTNAVQTYKSKFENVERNYENLNIKYKELNSSYDNMKKLLDSLQSELVTRENKINELANNNIDIQAQLIRLQSLLEDTKKDVSYFREELGKVSEEKEKLETALSEAVTLIQKNKEPFIKRFFGGTV